MPRNNFTKLGQLAIPVYQEYAQLMCENEGKPLIRNDGCCFYENKEVGCSWFEFCKEFNRQKEGENNAIPRSSPPPAQA